MLSLASFFWMVFLFQLKAWSVPLSKEGMFSFVVPNVMETWILWVGVMQLLLWARICAELNPSNHVFQTIFAEVQTVTNFQLLWKLAFFYDYLFVFEDVAIRSRKRCMSSQQLSFLRFELVISLLWESNLLTL